jgi:hypothetical protein
LAACCSLNGTDEGASRDCHRGERQGRDTQGIRRLIGIEVLGPAGRKPLVTALFCRLTEAIEPISA